MEALIGPAIVLFMVGYTVTGVYVVARFGETTGESVLFWPMLLADVFGNRHRKEKE